MTAIDARVRVRFLAKTRRNGDCWEWTGARMKAGYGELQVGSLRDGSRHVAYAHRLAYEIFVGTIPPGMTIDHLCRNRACVSAAHLEVVTNRENILRGISPAAQHARKTHCPNGHPYDEIHGRGRGCNTCRNARRRELRSLRQGQALPPHVAHGTANAYTTYSCHCAICRVAHAAYVREWQARRRAS